jgi:PAS domain S-box-containing protein
LGILVDLTERRRAEAALRESEERYRRFVQLSAEGVWRFDAKPPVPTCLCEEEQARQMLERGNLAECNDAYARQHGYERASDMIGKRLRDIMYGTPEQQLAIIRLFIRSHYRIIDLETVGTDREGKPRSYLNNVVGIVENDKVLWGWGTQRDITERKKAEAALRLKTENMQRLLDLAPLSMVVADSDGQMTYLNPKFTELFGYTLEDIPTVAIFWRKTFPDTEYRRRNRTEWRRRVAEATARGTGLVPMTARFTCKDRSQRYVESHAMPMGTHTLTIHVDLTERRRAEAALRDSEARYRRFVQMTAEGVARMECHPPVPTDLEEREQAKLILERTTVAECNDAYARAHGFARAEDVINKRLVDIMQARRDERIGVILRFIRSHYRVIDLESAETDGDGNTRWYLNNIVGILDEQGLFGGWGTQRDITARRASEEALRGAHCELERRVAERTAELSAANERLRELDRMKSQFLAMMSHELRTPLNSIIGFTGILRQGLAGPINEEQAKQLGISYQSALHLLSLINDLLDLSRLEAGKMRPEHLPFDFSDVVTEALANESAMARCKGLRLVSDVPAALLMVGDRKRTLQVLLNLVDNAVKFTPTGEVKVTAATIDGKLRATVSDTGIGIRQEHIGLLFEAFRQLDATSRRVYEGTGLGLYLCRKLLKMMGGEIWVESEFGKGSRFTFTLPLELSS